MALLEVKDLRTYFYTQEGVVKAVDGTTYSVEEGEVLGLVGESGCGKSVSALSILRLIPQPPGKIVSGEIIFAGRDLLKLDDEGIRMHRRGDCQSFVAGMGGGDVEAPSFEKTPGDSEVVGVIVDDDDALAFIHAAVA